MKTINCSLTLQFMASPQLSWATFHQWCWCGHVLNSFLYKWDHRTALCSAETRNVTKCIHGVEYFRPVDVYLLVLVAAVASINQTITETRVYRRVKSEIPVWVPLGKQLSFAWSVTSHFLSSVGIQLFEYRNLQQLAWGVVAVAGTWSFGDFELNLGLPCFNHFLWKWLAWVLSTAFGSAGFEWYENESAWARWAKQCTWVTEGNYWKWSSLIMYVKFERTLIYLHLWMPIISRDLVSSPLQLLDNRFLCPYPGGWFLY